jgi:diaminopimelate decarboxylase
MPIVDALSRDRLCQLLAEHGDSIYLLDTEAYRRNIREFFAHFRDRYPRIGLGHSYKTNYIPQLCKAAYAEGAYAEVVSRMEFDMAQRFGAAPERIILNGPVKDDALLRDALLAGCIVNVDSEGEAVRVMAIADAHPDRQIAFGLRLNLPMGGRPRSRFGIDVDARGLPDLIAAIRERSNLTIAGIHCHIGGDRSAASYVERTERMIQASKWIFHRTAPRYIDVGGGLAGRMPDELKAQLAKAPPSLDYYADAIAGTFSNAFPGHGPELIVEPGMGLVADVLWFACEVASTKRIGDQLHAIVTGSIYNLKPTLNSFDLPFTVLPKTGVVREEGEWCVSGYTCMEIDVIHKGWKGALAEGDILLFGNAGAYTVVLKPPFIKAAPAIVELQADGTALCVKAAETLDDVLSTYRW